MRGMKRCWWLLVLVLVMAAVGTAQKKGDAAGDNFVGIEVSKPEEQSVMKAFEPFARAVLARDYEKARKLMLPEVQQKVPVDALRGRYVDLESQYGELKKIKVQGLWIDKPSPKRVALVVVREEHEWTPVPMTYALVQEGDGWKVIWFRMGGKTPGGTFSR